MDLNQAIEGLGKSFEEFKKTNDARIKEVETKGQANSETLAKLAKIEKDMDESRETIKGLESALSRKTRGGGDEGTKGKSELEIKFQEGFRKFLRKGDASVFEAAEFKDMHSHSDPDGGYLVPTELSSEIVKKIHDTSPLRPLCSVQSIGSSKFEILQDLDLIASGWVGEQQARPKTDTSKLKKLIIEAHEQYAEPLVTQNLLDDAEVNLESWLADKAGEVMAIKENLAFVSGDGIGKPKGFSSYANGTGYGTVEQLETAASNAIAFDDIIGLQGKLKQAYRANGTFGMHRDIFTAVRKLKDLDNQYLWQPSLQAGQPDLLLGKPLVELNDMPSGLADNDLAIVFADFRAGYQIVDRMGVRLLRDPYSNKPYVAFYFTKRVGGGVKNFEAVKLLKIKA